VLETPAVHNCGSLSTNRAGDCICPNPSPNSRNQRDCNDRNIIFVETRKLEIRNSEFRLLTISRSRRRHETMDGNGVHKGCSQRPSVRSHLAENRAISLSCGQRRTISLSRGFCTSFQYVNACLGRAITLLHGTWRALSKCDLTAYNILYRRAAWARFPSRRCDQFTSASALFGDFVL
jgi:hypothetical protein